MPQQPPPTRERESNGHVTVSATLTHAPLRSIRPTLALLSSHTYQTVSVRSFATTSSTHAAPVDDNALESSSSNNQQQRIDEPALSLIFRRYLLDLWFRPFPLVKNSYVLEYPFLLLFDPASTVVYTIRPPPTTAQT